MHTVIYGQLRVTESFLRLHTRVRTNNGNNRFRNGFNSINLDSKTKHGLYDET